MDILRKTLLLVDDEPANLHVLKEVLQADYRLLFARNGERALQLATDSKPDLILLDIMMPDMTGLEVCAQLKSQPHTQAIPVIFVTALGDVDDESRGFKTGCVDYISKPISPAVVKARVKTHLSLVSIDELRETRLQIVQRLGLAAEYKDNETGLHVIRMSHYSRLIAEAAGLNKEHCELLLNAAPMHDIGKIGVPDAVLGKPGKLDASEWAVMAKHPEIGARIIGEHSSDLLQMARQIALYHHEKWDGSGYPYGLAGEDIPIEARIVAIADVFDALTSERPYKRAWSVDDALALIQREAGIHFDPQLVEHFMSQLPAVLAIKQRWAEDEHASID